MNVSTTRAGPGVEIVLIVAVVMLQVLAAVYFVLDALSDGTSAAGAFEIMVAFALLAGIVLGAATILRLVRQAQAREATLAIARGALSGLLVERFAAWGLSKAEADVALFALKGSTVAEIAQMRGAAPSTVRVQLSQVYAKASVSSQVMLMSLFLDDLMSEEGLGAQP